MRNYNYAHVSFETCEISELRVDSSYDSKLWALSSKSLLSLYEFISLLPVLPHILTYRDFSYASISLLSSVFRFLLTIKTKH